jgi:hypothetical protein
MQVPKRFGMGFLADVVVGTAVIVLPKHNFVLLGLAGAIQCIKALKGVPT